MNTLKKGFRANIVSLYPREESSFLRLGENIGSFPAIFAFDN